MFEGNLPAWNRLRVRGGENQKAVRTYHARALRSKLLEGWRERAVGASGRFLGTKMV